MAGGRAMVALLDVYARPMYLKHIAIAVMVAQQVDGSILVEALLTTQSMVDREHSTYFDSRW